MIYIPRPPAAPRGLIEAAAREMEAYRTFIEMQGKPQKTPAVNTPPRKGAAKTAKPAKDSSKSFEFKAYRLDTVKAALEAAFHFKCAYCESDYSAVANVRIEHFRPKGRVDRQGMPPVGGYYWLAAEWSNLLPSCERCNSPKKEFIPALNRIETVGKANWFPLWDETTRAAQPDDEQREYPLLLNPCEEDPEEYLTFDENGMVEPIALLCKRKKAEAKTSIRLYGLWRLKLVKARHEYAKRVLGQIEHVVENYEEWCAARDDPARRRRLLREWDELAKLRAPDAPYQSLTKQLIARKVTARLQEDIAQIW